MNKRDDDLAMAEETEPTEEHIQSPLVVESNPDNDDSTTPRLSDSELGFAKKSTVETMFKWFAALALVAVLVGVGAIYYVQSNRPDDFEVDAETVFAQHPIVKKAMSYLNNSEKAREYIGGKNIVFEKMPFNFQELKNGSYVLVEFRCYEKANPDERFQVYLTGNKKGTTWEFEQLTLGSSTDAMALIGDIPKRSGGSAFAE